MSKSISLRSTKQFDTIGTETRNTKTDKTKKKLGFSWYHRCYDPHRRLTEYKTNWTVFTVNLETLCDLTNRVNVCEIWFLSISVFSKIHRYWWYERKNQTFEKLPFLTLDHLLSAIQGRKIWITYIRRPRKRVDHTPTYNTRWNLLITLLGIHQHSLPRTG